MAGQDRDGTLNGKTCLVTGATSGIGEVAARELARRGARVIIVGRSPERCAATLERIRSDSPAAAAESLVADLSSQASVRRLADQVLERCTRLDVLLNNAGGMFLTRRESVDGIEMTLALNHLSCFLLTNLLLPLITASAPARIVNVASDAHKGASIQFDDLQFQRSYSGWRAYQQSKLANILFTYELARRLEGTGVTVNTLHPGFVRTGFFREMEGWKGWVIRRSADLAAISPEQGARTLIYLASSPEAAGVTGRYFVKEKPAASSATSQDRAVAQRLWRVSQELTGMPAPAGT
jgi:NAD(P)-dependent dehydrogenase (short-subunit alcohol dehydrogenase family)